MKIALWIVQGLLALAFFAVGLMKLIQPMDVLMAEMPWVNDFTEFQIRGIAALEIAGSLGLILPMFVRKLRFLVILAAVGLLATMIVAMMVHIGRGEPILPNVVLGALSLFVIFGRLFWKPKDKA